MTRALKMWAGLGLTIIAATAAQGFALLGPYYAWQVERIGYNLAGDIGGPKTLNEGYRWNIPIITYAFDQSFVNYFGPRGIQAVEEAIAIFNNLPPMNSIRDNGVDLLIRGVPVPTDTLRRNDEAEVLGLLDVKSVALHLLLEELGLAEAERYVWTLRARATFSNPDRTNYSVIQLNFDPITRQPSRFVNGVMYRYDIFEFQNPDVAEPVEDPVDVLATFPFSSVSFGALGAGRFFTGLTRDDIGGLRWLYGTNNLAVENLLTNITLGTPLGNRASPWTPFFIPTNTFAQGTNFLFNTNALRVQGLRPGVNKITFRRVNFDSLVGQTFLPITNLYTDTLISNSLPVIQPVQRRITQPDIIFIAEPLGLVDGYIPAISARSTADGNWINNDALNGRDSDLDGGPGVIPPTVEISFSDQLPFLINTTGSSFVFNGVPFTGGGGLGLEGAVGNLVWGSFDGTTNAPVIYPQHGQVTLQYLRQFVVGGGN